MNCIRQWLPAVCRTFSDQRKAMFILGFFLFAVLAPPASGAESVLLKKHRSSLAAWWNFNENRSVIVGDSSQNSNHGLLQGDPQKYTWSSDSIEGTSLSLSQGAFVLVENSSSLSLTGDLTISCWVLPRSVSGKSRIISKRNLSNEFSFYLLGIEDGKIFGGIGDGKGVSLTPKEHSITQGVWQFVVMVFDSGSQKLKLFVDGRKVSETSAGLHLFTGDAKLSIGADYEGMTDFFDGTIDELAIFNTAISDSDIAEEASRHEILSLRTLNDRQIEARRRQFLIGTWDFDIGQGTIVRDRSGKNNHALMKNMDASSWKEAFIGHCLAFDGLDDYLLIKHSTSLDLRRGFTLSTWVYPEAFGERSKIIAKRKESDTYNFYIIGEDSGKLYGGLGNGEVISVSPKMTSLKLKEWQHIAVTFNLFKGKLVVYLNGKKVEEIPCEHMANALDASLVIGSGLEGKAGFFKGMLDEVEIYSIGLPEISIQTIYDKSYFRFKAAQERREKLKKILAEIEEYKGELISVNKELGVFEDIGAPEKDQEEQFLKRLKQTVTKKRDELDYQKKVKLKKIADLNKTIKRNAEDINVIYDILSFDRITPERLKEDPRLSFSEMDKQIRKGEDIKKRMADIQRRAREKMKGKTQDLKDRVRELDREISREKSRIKTLTAELEIPESFPTFFIRSLRLVSRNSSIFSLNNRKKHIIAQNCKKCVFSMKKSWRIKKSAIRGFWKKIEERYRGS